jgi:ribokinase
MIDRAPRIAVVGSINADVFIDVATLPRPHETLSSRGIRHSMGGKGLNQAVAARRMGADVAMIGAVGADGNGGAALAHLLRQGIAVEQVTTIEHAPTGTAHILVAENGDNMIAVTAGANAALTPALVGRASEVIASADVLIAQLETPFATIAAALSIARAHGVRTILNPAPASVEALDLLSLVDLVTPNETELESLAGRPIDGAHDLEEALRVLVERGAGAALVTLGRDGSAALQDGRLHRQPIFPIPVVDTTGAGDAYNGALAYALASGQSLGQAMRLAAAAGTVAVSRASADAAPTFEEAAALLAI